MKRVYLLAATCFAGLLAGHQAAAVEPEFEPIPSDPPVTWSNPAKWPFDVSFGAAVTTNYVSRGITNSGNEGAIQGYVEPSIGPVYFNVWSSNGNFGEDFEGAEIDTALGVRPEFGPLKL